MSRMHQSAALCRCCFWAFGSSTPTLFCVVRSCLASFAVCSLCFFMIDCHTGKELKQEAQAQRESKTDQVCAAALRVSEHSTRHIPITQHPILSFPLSLPLSFKALTHFDSQSFCQSSSQKQALIPPRSVALPDAPYTVTHSMAFTPFTTLSRSSTRHVGLAPQRRLIHTTPRAPCILHSPIQQQSRANISCQGVLNTDVSHSESWALNARAAVLSLKEEELTEHIQSTPDNAWLAVCDPQRKN